MSAEFKIQSLPPQFEVENITILKALNAASRALGELRGEIKKIPNSQILIDTIALQEAKDSNEVENIVTTDDELYQSSVEFENVSQAAKEAQSYASALKLGFSIIKKNGILTTNDIKKIQEIVSPNHPVRKVPGTVLKNPKTQEVVFTPPQNHIEIIKLLENLEVYINDNAFHDVDGLIKMPIIHYQFESIHPFYDGNGRTGRILNILYLVAQGLLDLPVLYLSHYLIRHKADYYHYLQHVRDTADWEGWLLFMLDSVEETSKSTITLIKDIKALIQTYKLKMRQEKPKIYRQELLNNLFNHPYTKIEFVMTDLEVTRMTATKYLDELTDLGLLQKEKVGRSSYYINVELLQLLMNRA